MLHKNKGSKPFVRYLDGGGTLDNQPLNRMEDNRFIQHDGKLPSNRMPRSHINVLERKRKTKKKKSNKKKYKLKKSNGFNKNNNDNNATDLQHNPSYLLLNNNNNINKGIQVTEDRDSSLNVMENMMDINLDDLSVFNLCQWILLLPTYKQYVSKDTDPYQYDLCLCQSLSNFLYEHQINGKTLNRDKNIDWFHDLMNCLHVKELYNGKQLRYEWIFEYILQCQHKNENNNSLKWINKSWTKHMIQYGDAMDNLFVNLCDLSTYQLSEWIQLLPTYHTKNKNHNNIEICNELSQFIVEHEMSGKCVGKYDNFKQNDFFNMIKSSKLSLKQDIINDKYFELTYGWIWDRICECQLIAKNAKSDDEKSTDDMIEIGIKSSDESKQSDTAETVESSNECNADHEMQINVMDEYHLKYESNDHQLYDEELEWKRNAKLLLERIKKIEIETETAQRNVIELNSKLAKKKYKVKCIQKQMEDKLQTFKTIKQTNRTLKIELQSVSIQSISITE